MAENDISISEMTNGTFTSGALFPAISPNQGGTGYYNVKMSGADIGDGIGQLQFPLRLETENKSIFGAINEAAKSVINFLPIDTASGAMASFPDGANGIPLQSLILNVKPYQAGTGDPSPSNVRPISGHDTAVITRTGANVLPTYTGTAETINGVTFTPQSDGSVICNGTASGTTTYRAALGAFKWDGIGNYWLSGCPADGGSSSFSLRVDGLDAAQFSNPDNGSGVRFGNGGSTSIVGTDLRFTIIIRSGYNCNNLHFKPILNAGLTATEYEPYTEATRTAEFGQTIYGATIDPLTGTGSITRAIVDMGSLSWERNAQYNVYYANISDKQPGRTNLICSQYKTVDKLYNALLDGEISGVLPEHGSNTFVNVKDDRFSNVEDFTEAVTGAIICYELATPVPITFTPIENINTLYGANNIFQDAGDIFVTYKADIGLYIAKKTA